MPQRAAVLAALKAPEAPEPKSRRVEENRPEPARVMVDAQLDFTPVFRLNAAQSPPALSSPQKIPLYLRNSRLLI